MLTAARWHAARRAATVLWLTALGLVLTAAPALATEGQGRAGTGDDDLVGGVILAGVAGVVVGILVSLSAETGAERAGHDDEAGH